MQETTEYTDLGKYYDNMSWEYYQQQDYSRAIDHAQKWSNCIALKYGTDCLELAPCYLRLAKIIADYNFKEIELIHSNPQTLPGCLEVIIELFRPMARYSQNIELPTYYYIKAYNIMRTYKGQYHADTIKLKKQIVAFEWKQMITPYLEQTFINGSLLMIAITAFAPKLFGISWRLIYAYIIIAIIFTLWHMINLVISVCITKAHYEHHI